MDIEKLFNGKFAPEVKEALFLLKTNKKQEMEDLKTKIVNKRKEIGNYRAEADLYEAMVLKFPKQLEYAEQFKKSNDLCNKTSSDFAINQDSKGDLHRLGLEIEEIGRILDRYQKDALRKIK